MVDAFVPADPSKVRAYGPGLSEGVVGKPAPFTIETMDAGNTAPPSVILSEIF